MDRGQAAVELRSACDVSTAKTDILLATYNGARHLPELLASLDAQTNQAWRLIVRDDGSTDDSVALVKAWGAAKADRLTILEDGRGNLGASGNFGALLEASDGAYFLPCDQDDVWLPDKVERFTKRIAEVEAESGADRPAIVHSDLIVADENLRPIAQSFWKYQRIRVPESETPWKFISVQNMVTGCAMIGNAALRNLATPIPPGATMHDWWLASVAAFTGRIVSDPRPSVLYRQHGSNTIGAKKWSNLNLIREILSSPGKVFRRPADGLADSRARASAVAAGLDNELSDAHKAFLNEYIALRRVPYLKRKLFPFKHDLWCDGFARNVALFLGF